MVIILKKKTKNEDVKNEENDSCSPLLPICMFIGLSVGSMISYATENMIWMAIGPYAGLCLGAILSHNVEKDNKEKRKKK